MERELTPQELERKGKFEKLERKLIQEGYVRRDLTTTILKANVYGLLSALPFAAVLAAFFLLYSDRSLWRYTFADSMLFILSILVGIVVHELLHGLTWGICAEHHFHAISFGVVWKQLTPYCTCSDALTKGQYILGTAMPTLILGGVVGILSVSFSNLVLWLFAMTMIFSGAGDLLIIFKILRFRTDKKEVLYYDHPYEVGVIAFER